MRRNHTFEILSEVYEIELEIEYTTEPDCEIKLVDGWEQHIVNIYIAAAQQIIRSMPSRLMDLEFDNAPAQWAKENVKCKY